LRGPSSGLYINVHLVLHLNSVIRNIGSSTCHPLSHSDHHVTPTEYLRCRDCRDESACCILLISLDIIRDYLSLRSTCKMYIDLLSPANYVTR